MLIDAVPALGAETLLVVLPAFVVKNLVFSVQCKFLGVDRHALPDWGIGSGLAPADALFQVGEVPFFIGVS